MVAVSVPTALYLVVAVERIGVDGGKEIAEANLVVERIGVDGGKEIAEANLEVGRMESNSTL